jgi:hypothetical protein
LARLANGAELCAGRIEDDVLVRQLDDLGLLVHDEDGFGEERATPGERAGDRCPLDLALHTLVVRRDLPLARSVGTVAACRVGSEV